MNYQFSITAESRVGCVRSNNEDMLLIGDHFVRDDSLDLSLRLDDGDRYLLALADGMGGHNCGEVASSDTLHNLQFFYGDMPAGLSVSDFNDAIFTWLASINHIIDTKGRDHAECHNMGTTLVALALYENRFFWMNCGDSRLYRLHNGELSQLTTDHSLSNLMGQTGHSNVITNCIGGGCNSSYIDIFECTDLVQPGDTLLLCSDGLSDMIDDDRICAILNGGGTASTLCDAAEASGGYDNVSAIVIRNT